MGPAQERHPGDPEEKQLGTQFRGVVPQRVHDGVA